MKRCKTMHRETVWYQHTNNYACNTMNSEHQGSQSAQSIVKTYKGHASHVILQWRVYEIMNHLHLWSVLHTIRLHDRVKWSSSVAFRWHQSRSLWLMVTQKQAAESRHFSRRWSSISATESTVFKSIIFHMPRSDTWFIQSNVFGRINKIKLRYGKPGVHLFTNLNLHL